MRTDILVVGAGQAALQLASSLRDGGFDGSVTLLGAERHAPYQRPPLSKGFLNGSVAPASLAFRSDDWYVEQSIDLRLDERARALELVGDGSGVLQTARDAAVSFSRLVLATGARARRLEVPGADALGVHYLRSVDDAAQLRTDLQSAREVVVLGGGFVGLEAAATARATGRCVTVVEVAPRLLGRAVGPDVAAHVQAAHEAEGTHVLVGAQATQLLVGADGRVRGVELGDGTVLPAQLVLVGIGALPRTELAQAAGLHCAAGVVVDRCGRASDGVTLAIGDCASVLDPTPGAPEARLRLESVDSAVEQARAAAQTLLGRPTPYAGVPWFWSDQGPLKLQTAGIASGVDHTVVRREGDGSRLTCVHYRGGRMVAAEVVNAPAEALVLRRALERGLTFPPHEVEDSSVALKSMLRTASGVLSA